MFSVLIVDDERWMRDTIEKSIDWGKYGLRVAGKANDGLKAYDMILELKPDIVLADIKMPGMDGITLLKRVIETGIQSVFIFFSGFDRFEYAKDAINLGALGYILKPVDERELLEMLKKARAKIESDRQTKEANMQLVSLSEKEIERRKMQYVQRHLEGIKFDESSVETIDPGFISDTFIVAVIEIDRYLAILKNDSDKAEMMKLGLYNLCIDYFESYGIKAFVVNYSKGVKVLINIKCEQKEIEKNLLFELFDKMTDTMTKNYHVTITIGVGIEITGKERIHESEKTAVKALEHKLIAGVGKVIQFCSIREAGTNKTILDSKMEKKIIEGFEKCDFSLPDNIVKDLRNIMYNTPLSVEDIRIFTLGFVELIYRIMNKSGLQTAVCTKNPSLIYDEMNQCEDMEQLLERYFSFINENLKLYNDHCRNYYARIAECVKQYIHEHYSENISLESVADELAFHPNYISRIFKEFYGENFIDYLTNYRIEVAKELLREDVRCNISAVASMVGYNNPKYFSKVFKKVMGITPIEFIGKNK